MKDQNNHNSNHTSENLSVYKPHLFAHLNYPASEDIYNKSKEAVNVDPEDISKMKSSNEDDRSNDPNEKDFKGNMSAEDLDVPGNESDEAEENEGSEDEENNYYSLGGDDHNDLDELQDQQ